MPLVRVEVRNGYALGAPELYRGTNKEDPKEILESVSVAGLVGVLRQLGDLAEFAAEVFHGVQEEVAIMSSRSRKLMGRVQCIEASLSPLEKAVLAQKSHLHFAYTAGSNWHARIRCRQNHFVYGDLPQFIMDSYDDCRDPPRLHLLDKFDAGGPGSCLKRYSDPTFFRRLSETAIGVSAKKITKDKKGHRSKKRRSRPRNAEVSRDESFAYYSGRMQFTQMNIGGHSSPSQTATTVQSELDERPNSDLRDGLDYVKGDFRPSYSTQPEEQESRESISSAIMRRNSDFLEYDFLKGEITDTCDGIRTIPSLEQAVSSSSVTWDEKGEMPEHITQESDNDGPLQEGDNSNRHISNLVIESPGDNTTDFEMVNRIDLSLYDQFVPPLASNDVLPDDIESETDHFMDALNVIESDGDTDFDGMKKQEMQQNSKLDVNIIRDELCPPKRQDLECQSSTSETNVVANGSPINAICEDLDSMSQKSPQETNDYIGVPEKDGVNLVSIVDETVLSSQTDEVSLTPSSPLRVDWTEKQNLVQSSKLVNNEVLDEVDQAVGHDFEFHQSLSTETNVLANGSLINTSCGHLNSESSESLQETDGYFNGVTGKDEYNSASFCAKTLPTSQADGVSSIGSSPLSADSHENGGVSAEKYVKSVSCAVPSNSRGLGLGVSTNNGSTSSLESQRHVSDTSSVAPVTFWTNGGLLGLQPSKPPDFGASNGIAQDPVMAKERRNTPFDHPENLNNVSDDGDMSGSNHNQESGASSRKPTWKISPADLGVNLGKFGDSLCSSTSSIGSSATVPGSLPPVNLASQTTTKHQENNRNSSQLFEFSNRLLSKASTKRLSPGVNVNSTTDDQIVSAVEQKNSRNVGRTFIGLRNDLLFCNGSPIFSPSSSPPLQHMKISFQPTDRFENSKLKLKFPDGNVNSGSVSDMFPSFQLVPEASITQQVSGYESDDDAFYKSSPSLSDRCHSDQSESNSEQWESSEPPTRKDYELYNALRRISLTDSISSVPENVRAAHEDTHNISGFQFPHAPNGLRNSESSRMCDLRGLGAAKTHSFRKEPSSGTNMNIEPQAHPSAPPPLPPVEWRGTMPHLDGMEDKCEMVPETFYSGFRLHRSASTISQPKPAPSTEDNFNSKIILKSKSNLHKMNGQRETGSSRNAEDQGDFLHQIRTKSLNLRPTFIEKPAAPFEVTTHGQVSAILEKANAIRQAVGSDEDDNGTWSDT